MKKYLGDGVYFKVNVNQVILTTENGYDTTNTIVMEPEVVDSFLLAIQKLRNQESDTPHEWTLTLRGESG